MFQNGVAPIKIEDSIISLSAILLNDEYYKQLIKGKRTVEGYSIIEIETVSLFKIKAWLDLTEQKETDYTIDKKTQKRLL
ncbi:MAG: hypothetical protein GXY98_06990 [Erysipelothrix sp.]|nr:hypothetical protein [Erysipelothrix sp.]